MNYKYLYKLASDFDFLSNKPANQNKINLGKITIDFIDENNLDVVLLRNTAMLLNFNLADEIAEKIVNENLDKNKWEKLNLSFELQEPHHLVGEVIVRPKLSLVE